MSETITPDKLKRPSPIRFAVIFVVCFFIIGTPFSVSWLEKGKDLGLREFGLAAGLMGMLLLCVLPWLTSRLRCLDRFWGLEKFTALHKYFAVLALVLLLLHPILLSLSYGDWYLFSFDVPWQVWAGKITLLFLVGVVAIAFGFKLVGLNYQVWRFFHKGAIFLIPLAMLHALTVGLGDTFPKVWAIVAATGAILIFLYRNILVTFFLRRRFEVESVEPAASGVHTIRMKPTDGKPFHYHPGQYMFLKLKRPGRKSEEHPFTIASSPTLTGAIEATIKESGDFTNTIGQTRPGDTALVEGPFGKFSFVYDQPERFLFIAGGVGLTPILSMLRFLRDTRDHRPVFLLYGCRKEDQIVCREELENLPENVSIAYVLSDPEPDWDGPKGFIDRECLKSIVSEEFLGDTSQVYLCGPPVMMRTVATALDGVSFDRDRVEFEYFSL